MEHVKRPWGDYTVVDAEVDVVKILRIAPKSRLSLQTHAKRMEKWTAVTEGLVAIIGEDAFVLKPLTTYTVDVGKVHRIMNYGPEMGIIVETIHGEYEEDDIIRLEDDFGRDVL